MASLIRYEDKENVSKMGNVKGEPREVLKKYIAKTLFVILQQPLAGAGAAAKLERDKEALVLQQLYSEIQNTDLDLMSFRHNAIYAYIRNLNTKYSINWKKKRRKKKRRILLLFFFLFV